MHAPLRSASLLLLVSLAACDDSAGRDGGVAAGCVDAKCEDPNGNGGPQGANPGSDLVCHDGKTTEQRIEECREAFPFSSLWSKARPGFGQPDDLLYYVNRWHSIDPCFVDGASTLPPGGSLTRAQADYDLLAGRIDASLLETYGIESYGLGNAERPTDADWRSCGDKGLAMPALVTIDGGVPIREDAWQSPLPAGLADPDAGHPNPEAADGSRIQGFRALFLAAAEQNITLTASSGYRSAHTQTGLFDGYANDYGRDQAETFSAHPLHSEHQLGTAIDMQIGSLANPLNDYGARRTYANSEALAWVRDNAHRFGVVLSYPVDRVFEHQYVPEPWHFRFVGVEAATLMHDCQLSTEELMWGMYGDELPELPAFEHMELVTTNVRNVGYDEASCWFP